MRQRLVQLKSGNLTTSCVGPRPNIGKGCIKGIELVCSSQFHSTTKSMAAKSPSSACSGEAEAVVRFEELKISPELKKGLHVEMKFERPSKIQSVCLPMILNNYNHNYNLIAQAPDYSGKTTCLLLAMLARVDPNLHAPQAICLCSTRPTAMQNMQVLLKMGKFTGITSELCLPPTMYERSLPDYIPVFKRPPVTAQVIISSTGTIDDLIALKKLGASNIKILVFEEADHMLEDGFVQDCVRTMKEIVRWSSKCQVLLFLATFNDSVKTFVSTIAEDPSVQEFHHLFVENEEPSLDSVKQYKVNLPDEFSKITVIKDKIMELGDGVWQTIIFVRSRKSAEMLHEALVKKYGYVVTTIESALAQIDQDKIIKEFKDGLTRVLISGDSLSQVFDQCQVNLVVNYDFPVSFEVYLRRIGRAGRFGRKGVVFNLLCGDMDNMIMEKIERRLNHNATEVSSDGDFKDVLEKAVLK